MSDLGPADPYEPTPSRTMERVITHGEIRAVRYWRLGVDGVLYSLWRRHSWPIGGVVSSDELRPSQWSAVTTINNWVNGTGPITPSARGIHAYRDYTTARVTDDWSVGERTWTYAPMVRVKQGNEVLFEDHWVVMGEVLLWGDVIECRLGWLATHAAPAALYSHGIGDHAEAVERYARQAGLPILPHPSLDDRIKDNLLHASESLSDLAVYGYIHAKAVDNLEWVRMARDCEELRERTRRMNLGLREDQLMCQEILPRP